MTPVKKQQNKKKFSWKQFLVAMGISLMVGTLTVLVIDKYRMHQVICQFLGADEENGLVAARCMIR